MGITLSQVASWNSKLTNTYRTRWATAGGRYFQVSAEGLHTPWLVEEVTASGEWINGGFTAVAFTLAEARTLIATEVA